MHRLSFQVWSTNFDKVSDRLWGKSPQNPSEDQNHNQDQLWCVLGILVLYGCNNFSNDSRISIFKISGGKITCLEVLLNSVILFTTLCSGRMIICVTQHSHVHRWAVDERQVLLVEDDDDTHVLSLSHQERDKKCGLL